MFARVIQTDPAMKAQLLLAHERTHRLLAEVIAERTGTDVARDLAPRLLAAAAILTLRTASELWAEEATDTALPDLVDLLVYHARDYRDIVGDPLYDPNRHTRVQPLNWNTDGTPNFGVPVGISG